MISIPLYFLDGIKLSTSYERIVHGKRGDYVELKKEQILVPLKSHFINDALGEFYYQWLELIGRTEKIYWQMKTVKYADYKIGYYYISPDLLKPFEKITNVIKLF
jgi:hypothetical protein